MPESNPPRTLKHATLERLMHYYHYIGEQIATQNQGTVSSSNIAKLLDTDDTVVRKDMAAIGVRGYPRVGFKADEVMAAIRDVLGFDNAYRAIIIGAGRLGSAIASYPGFSKYGLRIDALIDSDPSRAGAVEGGVEVRHLDELESIIENHNIRLAILTVPAEAAQPLADRTVKAGVDAIWNFAPTSLVVPSHVLVRHEHISVGLAELAYHLNRRVAEKAPE
jgi:redox-sensing transcriptional repressor